MRKAWMYILLSILLLDLFQLSAQTEKDSLRHRLRSYQTIDTNYVLTLFELAYTYNRSGNDSMEILSKRVIEISDSLNYAPGFSMAYRALCAYYDDASDLEKSIFYGERAVAIADSLGRPFLKAKALNNLATVYEQDEPSKAISYILEALPLFKKMGDKRWEAIGNQTLGILYKNIGNLDKSAEAHERSLELYKESDPSGVPGEYINLGIVYQVKGETQPDSATAQENFSTAKEYLEKALEEFEKTDNIFALAVTNTNLGGLLRIMKKNYQALAAYDQALKYNQQIGHRVIQYTCQTGKIEILYQLGQLTESKDLALKVIEANKDIMNADNYTDLYSTLFKDSYDLGQYKEAYAFMEKKISWEKQIEWNGRLKARLNDLASEYESTIQKAELELLAEKQKRTQIWQMGLFGLLTVLFIGGIILLLQARSMRLQQFDLQDEKRRKLKTDRILAEEKLLSQTLEKEQLESSLKLKNQTLASYALQLAQKNEWLEQLGQELESNPSQNQLRQLIKVGLDQDRNWETMHKKFEELHPDFFSGLKRTYPDLTKADLRLAALYRLNMKTEEIIRFLAISPESFKMARYRLRKKIDPSMEADLYQFFRN